MGAVLVPLQNMLYSVSLRAGATHRKRRTSEWMYQENQVPVDVLRVSGAHRGAASLFCTPFGLPPG